MSEWISVEDRLPDVARVDDREVISPTTGNLIPTLYSSAQVLRYSEKSGASVGTIDWMKDPNLVIVYYTHWMPLPEPPE